LGGQFTRCNKDNLGQEILAALREAGYEEILAWSEENFQPGILDQLKSEGITVSHTPNPNIRAGLTASAAGIAETGSLVLTSGPGKPKTASLTTDLHLAVLKSSQITARLPEALNLEDVRYSSASVIISGPSRTADIEMTLSIGVHGPGAVHIFCLE
jgi:L-lactate dehydrogenase complex protein LldG